MVNITNNHFVRLAEIFLLDIWSKVVGLRLLLFPGPMVAIAYYYVSLQWCIFEYIIDVWEICFCPCRNLTCYTDPAEPPPILQPGWDLIQHHELQWIVDRSLYGYIIILGRRSMTMALMMHGRIRNRWNLLGLVRLWFLSEYEHKPYMNMGVQSLWSKKWVTNRARNCKRRCGSSRWATCYTFDIQQCGFHGCHWFGVWSWSHWDWSGFPCNRSEFWLGTHAAYLPW